MNKPARPDAEIPPLVVPLQEIRANDPALAGGKGACLSALLGAGFPVPPGFIITTAAYDHFIAYNHLGEAVVRALCKPQGTGAPLREAFKVALIPPKVRKSIRAAYRHLGQGPVAVRSSATAEDLPQATFAGQYTTYLNIVGPRAVLDAVQRCWASVWSDHAIAYRAHLGAGQALAGLAVIVQRMVQAEAAGVMFTANPLTGAQDEIVVEATPGLGEAIVSGLVTPDCVVLDKRSGQVKEQRLGRREVLVLARPGGGTERVDGPMTANAPALPHHALHSLAHLGVAIEQLFGGPQDIEWAWAGGKLFILQARPITALPPAGVARSGQAG